MDLQLIRNATMRLAYNGRLILTDPYLAAKHTLDSLAGNEPNPTAVLPFPPEKVIEDVEMIIVSHLHTDHFDPTAKLMLPRNLPLYCQPGNMTEISGKGFRNVTEVEDSQTWEGITLTRTPARHGYGKWAKQMGNVAGFILQAKGEPVVYWANDTVWYEAVEETIKKHQPDVIITHSGGAELGDSGLIVMDAEQTVTLCKAAPDATVVAIHMEALDHCKTTRAYLRALADKEGISPERLLIPDDGDIVTL